MIPFNRNKLSKIEIHFDSNILEDVISNNINNGNNILHVAILFRDANVFYISSLEKFNNTKNLNGNTPLHVACFRGNLELIKTLIYKHNVNIFETNNSGYTALDLAFIFNYNEISNFIYNFYMKFDEKIIYDVEGQIFDLMFLDEYFDENNLRNISNSLLLH